MRYFILSTIIATLVACSNSPDLETGEIRVLKLLRASLEQNSKLKTNVDTRKLISRKQIDAFGIPVLFIQLETGQNGTLTQYPGEGIGQTWLGADGATVTLDQGVLKATRGMGNDIMGGESSMPSWNNLYKTTSYEKKLSYLTGNNKLHTRVFSCDITKFDRTKIERIWSVDFEVEHYEETCQSEHISTKNQYYIDLSGIVRKSYQYHSESIGYLMMERLDR